MKTMRPPPTPFDILSDEPEGETGHRKGDLHANAVKILRNMIISGVLGPGTKLNERELCERLNVSRTPVREAIKALAQEGLLQVFANRSPVVAQLNPEETSSLLDVVATIEALAGELAAKRITENEIAELGILHYTMMRHHANDELPGYFKANKDFHRAILASANNSVLLWVWDLLALRVDRARYASNLWPERWDQAVVEHNLILERLKAHDSEGAAAAMRSHVQNGLGVVVQSLHQEPVKKPRRRKT